MKCERCSMDGMEAEFRVRGEVLNLKVCAGCASEARTLALWVEPLITKGPELLARGQKKLTDSKFSTERFVGL